MIPSFDSTARTSRVTFGFSASRRSSFAFAFATAARSPSDNPASPSSPSSLSGNNHSSGIRASNPTSWRKRVASFL